MFVSDFFGRVPYRNSSSSHLLMTLRRLFIYHQRSNSLSSPSKSYLLKQKQMLDSSVFPGQAHLFRASVLTESTVKIGGSKYRQLEIYPPMIVYCRQAKIKGTHDRLSIRYLKTPLPWRANAAIIACPPLHHSLVSLQWRVDIPTTGNRLLLCSEARNTSPHRLPHAT
jgi:hypothetical protein